MNIRNKKQLKKYILILKDIQSQCDNIIDEEEERFNNMSETQKNSKKGEKLEQDLAELAELSIDFETIIERLLFVTEYCP